MNARAPHAKMERRAKTMLILTLAHVGLVSRESIAKQTYPTVLKALASMEGHAQTKSMATPAPAGPVSLAPTVSMR